MRRFFTIFIFLSVLSLQTRAEDWRMLCLDLEREAFLCQDPVRSNGALILKAAIQAGEGEDSLAVETLERVRMSLLEPSLRDSLIRCKAELAFRSGDVRRSFAFLSAIAEAPSYEVPVEHSEALAIIFALPAGYIMGQVPPGRTVAATLVNFGIAAGTVLEILGGYPLTGLLGGGILLSKTYPPSIEEARLSVVRRSEREAERALRTALEDYFGK